MINFTTPTESETAEVRRAIERHKAAENERDKQREKVK